MYKFAFKILLLTIIMLVLKNNVTQAHQPNIVKNGSMVSVVDPTVSKAFYGSLNGTPTQYEINSNTEFELFISILSPDIKNAKKDFIVKIKNDSGSTIATLNAQQTEWKRMYEEFGGDWYWQGPEFKQTVPKGNYILTVENQTNSGKYVLAIGEAEVFTLSGAPHTILELYRTKTQFFGKPWYSIFTGVIGKGLLGIIISIAIVIAFVSLIFFRKNAATGTK